MSLHCSNCGEKIDKDSKFCAHCGNAVGEPSNLEKDAEGVFEVFRKKIKKSPKDEEKFNKEHLSDAMQQLMNNVATNQFNSLLEEHEEIKNLPHKAVNFIHGMFLVAASYGLEMYVSWNEYKKGGIEKLNGKSDVDVIRDDWKKKVANYAQEIQKFPDAVDRVMTLLRNQMLTKLKEDYPAIEDLPHKAFESVENALINIMLWSFWMAEVEGEHYRK